MEDHRTGLTLHNDDVEQWRSRVPPGVPGAGWVVGLVFAFSVVILTGWAEGWWDNHAVAAPTASHHMTNGVGN